MNDKDCSSRDVEVGGFKFSFIVVIDDLRDFPVVSCIEVEACSNVGRVLWQPHQEIVEGFVTGEATILPITNSVRCNWEKSQDMPCMLMKLADNVLEALLIPLNGMTVYPRLVTL